MPCVFNAHSSDRVQAIKEKVGIELRFESAQFCIAQCYLHLVLLATSFPGVPQADDGEVENVPRSSRWLPLSRGTQPHASLATRRASLRAQCRCRPPGQPE